MISASGADPGSLVNDELAAVVVLAGVTLPIVSFDTNGGLTLGSFLDQPEKSGCTSCEGEKKGEMKGKSNESRFLRVFAFSQMCYH